MLDFFTDPYPGELFISAISRYNHYSGNRHPNETNYDLFGIEIIKDKYLFNFDYLIKRLVKNLGGSYSLNDITSNNTLIPYYSISNKIFSYSKCQGLCIKSELYFCPKCIQEDIEKYGEAYFHREHQIRNISICYKHRTRIIKYKHGVIWNDIDDYHKFDQSNINTDNIQLLDNSEYDNLYKLSKLSYELLNNKFNYLNSRILSDYYMNKLSQKGFSDIRGNIKYYDLKNEIFNFYGDHTLKLLNENLDWIYDVTYKYIENISVINHLILINFFDLNINDFINEINNFKDNKIECYKKRYLSFIELNSNLISSEIKSTLIHKYPQKIKYETWQKVNAYIEKLENKKEKLINCKIKIIEFIRSNPEASKKEIIQILKMEYNYIYSKDRIWIDIYFSTNGQNLNNDTMATYKNKILEFQDLNPNSSRTKLKSALETEYNYVYKNDKKWIEKYVPTQQQIVSNKNLERYKQNIEKYVQLNPGLGRTKIREALWGEYNYVNKKDKKWIEKYVPKQQQIVSNENLKKYKHNIEEYVQSNPGLGRTKVREALWVEYNYVNKKDKKWIEKYVPKQQQIVSNENLKKYKQNIEEYVQSNPGLGRTKVREALWVEYNYVNKKDKKWIEKYVPKQQQIVSNENLKKYKQNIEEYVKLNQGKTSFGG